MTGTLAAAVILVSAGCGSPSQSASRPSPTATLSRLAPILDVGLTIKNAGSVLAILDPGRAKIRVDPGNYGEQSSINNAVILLRSSPQATVFVWTSVGEAVPGTSATTMGDLKIGEHVTFAFDQRSEDPSDGSYLARVVGRSRSRG